MTNKEKQVIKKWILEYLTVDRRGNQALFDIRTGWNIYQNTNLTMIMGCIVKGLQKAQKELKVKK
jgi:hypothetical protein